MMNENISSINTTSDNNQELQLAWQIIEQTDTNLFLTGKAGTGKTTFLRKLKENSPKRMIVLAPTGIAAINARGVTIHSFFQLPLAPYVPDSTFNSQQQQHYKLRKQKIDIIRSLDLLVIDEISMVRADLLDAVDAVLRQYRHNDAPFGGVQMLMIGDLQQLSPVVKEDELQMLSQYYDTMYFFGSHALQQTEYATVELKTVYRQSDKHFLDILNKVRENQMDLQTLQELNKRYIPNFNPSSDVNYIRLTTHNHQAQQINNDRLEQLPGKTFTFTANIEDDFPEYAYPTDANIMLKEGAQVMFIKNDPSGNHRFYNGMIGEVCHLNDNGFYVKSKDTGEEIEVTPEEWENCKYELDQETKEITEVVEGSFKQYPVKLAWAITIHKSQGLTFEHAIIDVENSFAHGQTYVALSRCKTLEGLVLNKPINMSSIICDGRIKQFSDTLSQHTPSTEKMELLKRQYFLKILTELFSFKDISSALYSVSRILSEHFTNSHPSAAKQMKQEEAMLRQSVTDVASTFYRQYSQIIAQHDDYDTNEQLADRINKGASYFIQHLRPLQSTVKQTIVKSGNKELNKRWNEYSLRLKQVLGLKIGLLSYVIDNGFTVQKYLRQKAIIMLGAEEATRSSRTSKAETKPKIKRIPTKEVSYKMFKDGKTVEQIAKERKLTIGTIMGHLAQYVELGEISIDQLVPQEHIDRIESFIRGKDMANLSYKEIHDALGKDIDYAEIRVVIESQTA